MATNYKRDADHWTIEIRTNNKGAIYCSICLRDDNGCALYGPFVTPYYSKGDAAKREHKARTYAGTMIANFHSGHQFAVPIRGPNGVEPIWPK